MNQALTTPKTAQAKLSEPVDDSLSRRLRNWAQPSRKPEDKPLDNEIMVVSPENIAFNYRVAGPTIRLLAFAIDWTITTLFVTFLAILILVFSSFFAASGLWQLVSDFVMISMTLLLLLNFALKFFYSAVMETWCNGRTFGKMLVGLRVVSRDGTPIRAAQAIMRNLSRAVELLPLISLQVLAPWLGGMAEDPEMGMDEIPWVPIFPTFIVGLVSMTLTRRFQRLGDIICGTMTIIDSRTRGHDLARLEDPRTPQLAAYIPANFVIHHSFARALAAYADRRRSFSDARKREIASHLAEPLLEQFKLPPDTSYDLFLCALYYRAFVADQNVDDVPELRLNEQTRKFEGVNREVTRAEVTVPQAIPVASEPGQLPRRITDDSPRR